MGGMCVGCVYMGFFIRKVGVCFCLCMEAFVHVGRYVSICVFLSVCFLERVFVCGTGFLCVVWCVSVYGRG